MKKRILILFLTILFTVFTCAATVQASTAPDTDVEAGYTSSTNLLPRTEPVGAVLAGIGIVILVAAGIGVTLLLIRLRKQNFPKNPADCGKNSNDLQE